VGCIVASLCWFAIFELLFGMGLVGAAMFRVANTMNAVLGYMDDLIRIGWFAVWMDDILAWIPTWITGCPLIILFICHGRAKKAFTVYRADHKKTPRSQWRYFDESDC
jgi:adenosylcobinamide-phosphate synthase